MVSRSTPRNTAQSAGSAFRIHARVVNANLGAYTVPAGKKARITDMELKLDAVGVDATYGLARLRSSVFTVISPLVGAVAPNNRSTATLTVFEAGDILTNVGDSGSTNGTADISATIEEFSA